MPFNPNVISELTMYVTEILIIVIEGQVLRLIPPELVRINSQYLGFGHRNRSQ
jgi:hypothetical protein